MRCSRAAVSFLIAVAGLLGRLDAFEESIARGNDLYQQGKYKEAVVAYREGLALGENPALIHFNIGNTYYNLGNHAKAIVSYNSSITEAPDFFRAYLNLGILYYNLNDVAAAVATLEHARELEPFNTQCLLVLAASYRKLGSALKAIPLLELVVTLDPAIDDTYFLLFDVNRELEDHAEAIRWLKAYPEKGKRVAEKYQLLAEMVSETESPEAAAMYYRKLIEVAPRQPWSHYYYVRNLAALGNRYSALEHAQSVVDQFKTFGNLCLLAGTIAFDAKLYRKAEFFYARAYARKSHDGLIGLQNLVKVYTSQNDMSGVDRVNRLLLSMK